MKYVNTVDMVIGRQIGKPIYNRNGVLLYNSGVKISAQMIAKFQEKEIYGTYVLDPGEPVPVMTDEEREFECFQAVQTYNVNDILTAVTQEKGVSGLVELVDTIYKRFGNMKGKMVFNQSIRSENDFISKHSLNVAILTAMISEKMGFDAKEKKYLIEAALYHDIGKMLIPPNILHKKDKLTAEEMNITNKCLLQGFNLLGRNYSYPAGVRRYIIQLSKELSNKLPGTLKTEQTLLPGTKILQAADLYDTLTAIRPYKDPISAFAALKIIRADEKKYDFRTVDALEACLNILPVGSYVKLNTGEQAIVIQENPGVLFRPVVLGLNTNKLYDFTKRDIRDKMRIEDTVFTADNRLKIRADQVREFMAKRKN